MGHKDYNGIRIRFSNGSYSSTEPQIFFRFWKSRKDSVI